MNATLHTARAFATQLLSRLWHRCRNLRCRVKLSAPVENEHHAFCTRGCYESFYRNRCRVCERDLRKTGKRGDAGRLYCRPPADCRREAEKWPEKYAGGLRAGFPETKLGSAHSTGLKTRQKAGRPFRVVAGPALSPTSFRLASLPLDPELAARLASARARLRHAATTTAVIKPRDWPVNVLGGHRFPDAPRVDLKAPEWATASRWIPAGDGAGVPPIPDFLQRHPIYRDAVAALRSAA
jgi:hypothetical protein